MLSTSSPSLTEPVALVGRMVPFALQHLPATRHPSGIYCFDVDFAARHLLRGESVRYSLMVLLGLQRADAAGHDVPDLDALWATCLDRRAEFTAGDHGLALWAGQRRDGAASGDLLRGLRALVPDDDALAPLVGMEIGWLAVGLARAVTSGVKGAERHLAQVRRELERRRSRSGLYRHHGGRGPRQHLPNFATQIYTLLALATLAGSDLDADAREHAEALAAVLLRSQLPGGAWPWLFDSERGSVVERYEIYSVHQDAMAPMALIEMSDLTGDRQYLDAAVAGLAWSHGANELGVDLFDETTGFAHRSIRRRRPWDRAALALNCAAVRTVGRAVIDGSPVELNRTCRPYHLGWILEAWAGRESLLTSDGTSS